jgi:hypothetical protein
MPLTKKLESVILYIGIGLSLVCFVVIGTFYAPAALESTPGTCIDKAADFYLEAVRSQ